MIEVHQTTAFPESQCTDALWELIEAFVGGILGERGSCASELRSLS